MRKIITASIIMALFAIAANANITTGNEETATQYFNVGNPIKFEDTDYYLHGARAPTTSICSRNIFPRARHLSIITKCSL